MGVYMSQPLREKDSIDEEGKFLYYGASSMQGWRMTQEDAHNCCLDYDKEKNMSLFAVYDGHGGAEVAQYTAINFPEFLKSIPQFKEGRLSQGLEDAFLAFDEELIKSDVITKLKELAGVTEDEQNEEERQEELKGLSEDADMPLEQLLQRYQAGGAVKPLQELRKSDLVPSPALRGKKSRGNTSKGNEDIKENLDEKLVNGEGDCNGDDDHTISDNLCKDSEGSSEVIGKGDCEINNKEAVASVKQVDTTESKCSQNDVNEIKEEEPIKEGDMDSECQQSDAGKVKEEVCSVSECSEAAASGPMDTKKSSGSIKDGKNAETLPDSTQADSTPNKTKGAKQDPKSEANGDTEVSSSSEGSKPRQTVCQPSTGSSSSSCETSVSVPEESGTNPSSSGESASLEQTTRSSSDGGGGGVLSSYSAVADSSSKAEPSSSSGRRRSGRKNVIPEEGEDESSFDDDEETTDEEDSDEDVDEGDLVEEDSEEDSEEEIEEEEGEVAEEEDGVAYSMEPGYDSGCTAVVAVLKGRELFVANAGDSRCVLCREGKAVDMSFDHKPEDEIELRRILNAGGQVTPDGRVNGGLNLSRAIGDHAYKKNSNLPLRDQMISALPDVRCVTLDEKDEFMVLACDGIWNSLSSQDTVTFVRDRFKGGVKDLSTICEELFECCLAPNTSGDGSGCDNMTCVIVRFKDELWKLPSCSTVKRRASSEADSSQTEPKKVKEGD